MADILLGLDGAELLGTDGAYLLGVADIYPVFATQTINSQVSFVFDHTEYAGAKPVGYLNWEQDPSEKTGGLATTETRDAIALNGIVSNPQIEVFPSYSSDAVNSQVTFNFQPSTATLPSGYLYWDLGPHSVIFVTLEVTEAIDTALFNGAVIVHGTLTTTETRDVAAFFGTTGTTLSGNLVFTEPRDIAAFNVQVTDIVCRLDTVEGSDIAGFAGNVIWDVVLSATERTDNALFIGELGFVSEVPDTAMFIGYVMAVPPILKEPEVLKFGVPMNSGSKW